MDADKLKARSEIVTFLSGRKRIMLLKGTFQNEKLPLAFESVLSSGLGFNTVLLRFNSFDNDYLERYKIDTTAQRTFKMKGASVIVDGMTPRTQKKTPLQLDCAIVYPVDCLKADAGAHYIHDLFQRRLRKLIFVTWTDNTDLNWLEQFEPVTVRYDAENLDPEYHAQMLGDEAAASQQTASEKLGRKLPKYAMKCPSELLTRMYCRRCNSSTWAKLNKPYPGLVFLKKAAPGEYEATCLKCNEVTFDNNNWFGQ